MSQGLCTSCGAAVNLPAEQDEINCTYCGTLVKRPEAEAQFAEVKNSKFGGMWLIAETAQEGGSYTEAINYYNKVIEQQPDFADAWLNKGICMVRTSKIGDLKIQEGISSWKAAIKFARVPAAMKKRVAAEINNAVSDFYPVLERHYLEFHNLDKSLSEHGDRFSTLESALSFALELSPTVTIAKNGVSLCDRFVASIKEAAGSDANDASAKLFLQKDWKGAVSSALTAGSKEKVASDLATMLENTKAKYEQVLAKYDPGLAAQVEGKQKKKQFAAASSEGSSKSTAGCGCLFMAILFVAFAVFSIWYDYRGSHSNDMAQAVGSFVISLLALFYAIKHYNKEQNRRDVSWIKDLPGCFGAADLSLALHSTEEEHFRKLVDRAIRSGFVIREVRVEVAKYLKDRGCTQQHIDHQMERYETITKELL